MVKVLTPTITREEFDDVEAELLSELRRWHDERQDDPDAPQPNPHTAGAFAHLPQIDSKAVATASPIINKYLGVRLDVKHIRRGGYGSFEELVGDLVPKLRASCPSSTTQAIT
jgi:hypothetical protein